MRPRPVLALDESDGVIGELEADPVAGLAAEVFAKLRRYGDLTFGRQGR